MYNNYDLSFNKKSQIIDALSNNMYLITFHFDNITETIFYEAYLKEEGKNLPLILTCNCNLANELIKADENGNILFSYITDRNKTLSSEEKNKIYSPILNQIQNLNINSIEELKSRNENRTLFNELISSIEQINQESKQEINGNVKLIINLYKHDDNFFISLKIGTSKYYQIKSFFSFISNINNNLNYRYGKGLEFVHTLDAFDKRSQLLISFISRNLINNYESTSRYLSISNSCIFELLSLFINDYIYFNDKITKINDYISADVSINDEGVLVYSPDLKGEFFFYKTLGYVYQSKEQNINLLRFNHAASQQLYKFAIENKDFDYNDVSDLLMNRLYPIIKKNVKASQQYQKKQKDNSVIINVYIDINKNDELIIKTKYILNNTEISKFELLDNQLHKNQIIDFENKLSVFNVEDNCTISNQEIIYNFLRSDISSLNDVCNLYLTETLKNRNFIKMPSFKINASFDMNWLNIDIKSERFNSKEISEILSMYNIKKKFFRINDDFIVLDDDSLASLSALQKSLNINDNLDGKKLPFYDAFKLVAYKDDLNISFNEKLMQILLEIKKFKTFKLSLSEKQINKLRPYQIDAVKWLSVLYKNHLCGILADDMGLGKTLEILTFTINLPEKPILIVTPKSLIFNWENEVNMWLDNQKIFTIDGTKEDRLSIIKNIEKNKKIIYVTSYDSLRNDINYYKNINFELLILDEAQYIKNAHALKTRAVKEINSNSRFVLTGTPIENSLIDLWSIFDFLMPNYLLTYDEFKQEYESSIIYENDKLIKKKLIKKISPFILRRTKKEVLKELPPKTETIYSIDMNDEQRKLYDAYYENAKNIILGADTNRINQLAILTRLRQICVDPSMFIENFNSISEKITVAVSIILNAIENNHKVLVFSSFTKSLDHLKNLLEEKNIPSFYIHGGVSAEKRIEIADSFNNEDNIKITLISLKAGGTGLNLIGADIVIHLDPWWNVAAENQASDRAHRIGQKNSVTVIKLICKNSIEEKVIKLQQLKNNLASSIILSGDKKISSLTQEDIYFLFN